MAKQQKKDTPSVFDYRDDVVTIHQRVRLNQLQKLV